MSDQLSEIVESRAPPLVDPVRSGAGGRTPDDQPDGGQRRPSPDAGRPLRKSGRGILGAHRGTGVHGDRRTDIELVQHAVRAPAFAARRPDDFHVLVGDVRCRNDSRRSHFVACLPRPVRRSDSGVVHGRITGRLSEESARHGPRILVGQRDAGSDHGPTAGRLHGGDLQLAARLRVLGALWGAHLLSGARRGTGNKAIPRIASRLARVCRPMRGSRGPPGHARSWQPVGLVRVG